MIRAAIAALTVCLVVAAPAGAQAPSLDDFKLRKTTVDLQARVDALAGQLPKSGVQQLLADANRTAVPNGRCKKDAFDGIPPGSRWFCFDRSEAGEGGGRVEWVPQGVTTVADAQEDGLWGGRQALLVSWYDSAVEPKKGVRVTFLDPEASKYRHVLLVYPLFADVADTRRGIRVFDMRFIFDLAKRPNHGHEAFGYRYVMPQVDAWVNAAGPDNDDPGLRCSGSGAPRFSYVALDRSETPDRMVTGEFCDRSGDVGRVARWPLDDQTGRPLTDPADGLVHASEAYRLARPQIQGAVSFGGTWYLSRSAGRSRSGQLVLARPDASPTGSLRATDTRQAGIGPEDLSYWPGRNEVWTVTEYAGRRMLYGMPGASAARATADDPGTYGGEADRLCGPAAGRTITVGATRVSCRLPEEWPLVWSAAASGSSAGAVAAPAGAARTAIATAGERAAGRSCTGASTTDGRPQPDAAFSSRSASRFIPRSRAAAAAPARSVGRSGGSFTSTSCSVAIFR